MASDAWAASKRPTSRSVSLNIPAEARLSAWIRPMISSPRHRGSARIDRIWPPRIDAGGARPGLVALARHRQREAILVGVRAEQDRDVGGARQELERRRDARP